MEIANWRVPLPLGSAHVVVAVDKAGAYRGLVLVPEAHALSLADDEDGGAVSEIVRVPETVLHPDVDVRMAMAIFDAAQTDILAVTERDTGLVVGTLGEAYAARRYAQESNLAVRGVLGGG